MLLIYLPIVVIAKFRPKTEQNEVYNWRCYFRRAERLKQRCPSNTHEFQLQLFGHKSEIHRSRPPSISAKETFELRSYGRKLLLSSVSPSTLEQVPLFHYLSFLFVLHMLHEWQLEECSTKTSTGRTHNG